MEANVKGEEDILRPLSDNEVNELFQLYWDKYGPMHFHCLLMYNQLKWDRQLQEAEAEAKAEEGDIKSLRKTFYTHRNGDFRKYGTYISIHFDIHQSVSFFSWQPNEPIELYECLEQTQRIEWAHGALLTNVDLSHCDRVKEIALKRGAASILNARQCYGMILSHNDALNVNCTQLPDEFQLRQLNAADAQLVHETWPNSGEGSLEYIYALIRFNKTLGVCVKETGELIAWIFQNDFAGLGILQVLPKMERRGLGGLLTAAMTKTIAENEKTTLSAWIVATNYRSDALLTKIGYQKAIVNEWIKLGS